MIGFRIEAAPLTGPWTSLAPVKTVLRTTGKLADDASSDSYPVCPMEKAKDRACPHSHTPSQTPAEWHTLPDTHSVLESKKHSC